MIIHDDREHGSSRQFRKMQTCMHAPCMHRIPTLIIYLSIACALGFAVCEGTINFLFPWNIHCHPYASVEWLKVSISSRGISFLL